MRTQHDNDSFGEARSHSCRNAAMGSTRVARRAGTYVANSATAKIVSGTMK